MGEFTTQVNAWCDLVLRRYLVVLRTATQFMVEAVQDDTPVISGILKASMAVTLNDPIPMDQDAATPDMNVALGSVAIGDTLYATYTAEYAARIEYGYTGSDRLGREYDQKGHGMIQHNLDKWQDYVDLAVAAAVLKSGAG
ncbi:hypothetical protein [Pseudochrobactrum sp. MP213Fo]|uniref:hypothetical protein n=1 Tax=Pseudochrobactrum sp. MP213Fo TaxID=3022250 RepID=UPI003BA31F78